jgi:hypothetical protein
MTMSRADDIRARAEAEIRVAELEEELVAAKDSGDVTSELKLQLREARQEFRELRAGDAVAAPEAVSATADVKKD